MEEAVTKTSLFTMIGPNKITVRVRCTLASVANGCGGKGVWCIYNIFNVGKYSIITLISGRLCVTYVTYDLT